MGKSAGKAPQAPSPENIANLEAQYNRIAEIGPLGSSYYSQGDDGTWARVMQYAPGVQNALNWQMKGVNQYMERAVENPMTMDQLDKRVSSRSNSQKNNALADMLSSAKSRWGV